MKSSFFIAELSFRCLKRDLGMTYKKLEIKPTSAATNQMFTKLLEGAKIQKCLKDKQVECIYIDEFKVITKHSQFGDGPREVSRDGSRQINQTSRCCLSELFRIIKSTVYLELKAT